MKQIVAPNDRRNEGLPKDNIGIFACRWTAEERNRERIVKVITLILTLVGTMAPCLVAAQTAGSCAACVGAAGCDNRQVSCVTECRARYFSIDPKRAACITQCTNTLNKCAQLTINECRTQTMCR